MSVNRIFITSYLSRLQPAWRWWVGELAKTLDWIKPGRVAYLDFDIDMEDQAKLRDGQAIGRQKRSRAIILNLPAKRMQRRRISLPLSAVKDLPSVVQYEFNRYFPLEVDQVFYSIQHAIDNARGAVSVEILCVMRQPVLRWMEQIKQQYQIEFREVLVHSELGRVECNPDAARDPVELRRAARLRRWQNVAIAALLALLAYLPLAKLDGLIEQQQARIEQLTRQAKPAMDIQARLLQHQQSVKQLRQRVAGFPRQARIWSLVNTAIGDKAIIDRMTIRQSEVTLTGISASVERVVKALDGHPELHGVRVNGSVQASADGSEEILDVTFNVGGAT